jgi:hypothetical protein
MSDTRDPQLERLLGEYQEDLRSQGPSPSVLEKLRQEQQRQKVVALPRRGARWAALALAASVFLAIGVYQFQPFAEPASQAPAVEMAQVSVPPPAPAQAENELARQAPRPTETAKPKVDPSAPPSIRAAMEAPAGDSAAPGAPMRAESSAAAPARVEAKAEAPLADTAVRARAEVPAAAPAGGTRAAGATSLTATVLTATVVREVWEPGQPARVLTGTFQRNGSREAISAMQPAEPLAMPQNSIAAPSQSAMPDIVAPPLQAAAPRRALSPVRDQIAEARVRQLPPATTTLGEAVIEGIRCTGTRTVDAQRVVERWHSAELNLDVLTRTTEANGAITVHRYVNIQRR